MECAATGTGRNYERHLGPRSDRADVAGEIFARTGSHATHAAVAHAANGHDDDNGEEDEDEDEAPETPLDEPQPMPVDDPPAEPIQVPYVVRRRAAGDFQ